MKFKTTFLLLIAACALMGLLKILHDRASGAESPVGGRLFETPVSDLTVLAMEKGGQAIRCEKIRGTWMVVHPSRTRADSGQIMDILSAVENLRKREIVTPAQRNKRGLSLDSYDLGEKPGMRLSFGNRAQMRTLLVGRSSLDAVYVREESSDTVVAVDAGFRKVAPADIPDLRSRVVLAGAPDQAVRFEITWAGGGFLQAARKGNAWFMQQPVKDARLNSKSVNDLLKQMFDLRIERFAETSDVWHAAGLDEARAAVRIGVWLESDTKANKLIISGNADGDNAVFAGNPDENLVFTIKKSFLDAIKIAPSDLRNRSLFSFDVADAAFIRLRNGHMSVELQKDTNAWFVVEPRRWKADSDKVSAVLNGILNFQAKEFIEGVDTNDARLGSSNIICSIEAATGIPDPPAGADKPAETNQALPKMLLLGAAADKNGDIWCKFKGETSLIRADGSQFFASLPRNPSGVWADPLAFWDTTMLSLDPSEITGLSLVRNGRKEHTVVRDNTGAWHALPEGAGKARPDIAADAMAAGAGLKYLRIESVSPKNLDSYGLSDRAGKLTFILKGEQGIRKTILLGNPTGADGVYAAIQGQDVVCVLPKELAGKLLRDLVAEGE